MADPVRINGNVYAHGSIVIKLDGERYHGFTSLSYGDKRERTRIAGMNKAHKSRGVTSGKYSTEAGKLKGPISSCQALRKALAAKAADGRSYGNVSFPIVAQWVENNTNQDPHAAQLVDCYIVAENLSHDEGTDATQEEITIDYDHVIRDGLTLFDATEGVV